MCSHGHLIQTSTQYYCELFYFALGSERENMSSGADAACMSISLSVSLINEKDRHEIKEWYKRRQQHTHE